MDFGDLSEVTQWLLGTIKREKLLELGERNGSPDYSRRGLSVKKVVLSRG
jgi:hypothetical protein